ncbi:NADPH-dependent FMN reductase [Methylopila musalis]|uniref:NADPH-dependent FMN reductase n=1 Tax=Methylopila musalis TaxID=1134781 RepID=A0ABW3Z9D6_9HYPH
MRVPLHIALIYGSARPGRLCDAVGAWTEAEIHRVGGFTTEIVDPRDALQDEGALRDALARADGFVVVTPEYNHSFAAPLKAVIDAADVEWGAKPVGFVSYGGLSGGLRAVEQLRLVFAELHVVGVSDSVALPDAWDRFDGAGRMTEPERPRRAMGRMLTRLRWWGEALKAARSAQVFTEAA